MRGQSLQHSGNPSGGGTGRRMTVCCKVGEPEHIAVFIQKNCGQLSQLTVAWTLTLRPRAIQLHPSTVPAEQQLRPVYSCGVSVSSKRPQEGQLDALPPGGSVHCLTARYLLPTASTFYSDTDILFSHCSDISCTFSCFTLNSTIKGLIFVKVCWQIMAKAVRNWLSPDYLCVISSPVPGRQPPWGLSVAGLVASGHWKHRLSSHPLGHGQEMCHGDCAAVLSRYSSDRF